MNQKVRYHVACCTDDNYVQACGVLLCSLFENNPNSRFHVHILIEEISEKNKQLFLSLVTVYDVLFMSWMFPGWKEYGFEIKYL